MRLLANRAVSSFLFLLLCYVVSCTPNEDLRGTSPVVVKQSSAGTSTLLDITWHEVSEAQTYNIVLAADATCAPPLATTTATLTYVTIDISAIQGLISKLFSCVYALDADGNIIATLHSDKITLAVATPVATTTVTKTPTSASTSTSEQATASPTSTNTTAIAQATATPTTPSAVAISSITPPSNTTYKLGTSLQFTVVAAQAVTVAGGTPSLALNIGGVTKNATYSSGSGTTSLVFSYTVQSGDNDSDGIATSGTIALNGATITGTGGGALATSFSGQTYGSILVWTPPSCSGFAAGTAVVNDVFNDNVAATNTGAGAVGTGWGILTNAHITATEASSRLSLDLSGGSIVDFDQYKMNSNQKQAFWDSQGVRVKWIAAPVSVTHDSSSTDADYAPMTHAALRYQFGWVDAVRSNASNADNQFWRLPEAHGTGGLNGGGGFYVDLYFNHDLSDATKTVVGGAINVATSEKTKRLETTTATDATKVGANGLGTFTFDQYDGSTPLTVTAILTSTSWTVCFSETVSMATGSLTGTWSSMPTPFTHNEFATSSLVTYGNAVFTAQATGVALVFDGSATVSSVVTAWNNAHASDHVTYFSKPGTTITGAYVPPAGTATLAATTAGGFAYNFVQALATGGKGTMGIDQVSVDRGSP